MFIFLCGGIVLAAVLLMRRGKLPGTGIVTGSSMEPILHGPRFTWTCKACSRAHEFALDSCKSNQPFRCCYCNFLDMESGIDLGNPESFADGLLPGAPVRFASLRSIRDARAKEIDMDLAHSSGLRRGDLVVLQESLGAKREIKRIVGFPFEAISIERGDIFVNGLRWSKSLTQSLRQSILVHSWDGADADVIRQPGFRVDGWWQVGSQHFSGVVDADSKADNVASNSTELTFAFDPPHGIDNRLAVNAHDSHAIVPVADLGVAWQLAELASTWHVHCKLRNGEIEPTIELEKKASELKIQFGDQSANIGLPDRMDKSFWIIVAMVDGFLIAGSQDEEWLRIELPAQTETHPIEGASPIPVPITITPVNGKMKVDQLLVFRDVHYRGMGDSESQTWVPENQMIVFGDNVSISSDSRDRWPEGLAQESIKGVVLQHESPMEVLLRQR